MDIEGLKELLGDHPHSNEIICSLIGTNFRPNFNQVVRLFCIAPRDVYLTIKSSFNEPEIKEFFTWATALNFNYVARILVDDFGAGENNAEEAVEEVEEDAESADADWDIVPAAKQLRDSIIASLDNVNNINTLMTIRNYIDSITQK